VVAPLTAVLAEGSAGAEEVFDGQPLQAGESVALRAGPVDVEVFERGAVLQQLVERLTFSQGGPGQRSLSSVRASREIS
jgi:hypothetical protein